MTKLAIRCLFAVLPLIAGTAVIPAPAHACNILNPPLPCANLPGANSVNGLGNLYRSQFQSIPGLNPFRIPGSAPPSPIRRFGSPDPIDGLVAPSQRNTFVVPTNVPEWLNDPTGGNAPITGRQPLPATDPSDVRPVIPGNRAQAREIRLEMEEIARDFYRAGGAPSHDHLLTFQLTRLVGQEESADRFRLKRQEQGREEPVLPVNPRQGLLRADNQTIEANNDSIMNDLDFFFVKM